MPQHRPGLHPPGQARTDDQVGLPGQDGGDQMRYLRRVIAVVAVQEDHNIGRAQHGQAGQAGVAVTPASFSHHLGARRHRNRRRAVGRAVVNHNDLANPGGYLGQDPADGLGFIQGRNDNVNIQDQDSPG